MRIDPDGAELLRLARQAVLDELLPQLPASAHYTARMVCNALAIAQRQLERGQAPGAGSTDADWRTLEKLIDAGELEGADEAAASQRQRLWQLTSEQLAESDPKALPG